MKNLREAEVHEVDGSIDLVSVNFPTMTMVVTKDMLLSLREAFDGKLKDPLPIIAEQLYVACRGDDKDIAHSLVHVFSVAKERLHPLPEQLELFEPDFTPEETILERIYEDSIDMLLEDPEGFITKMKSTIELQREALHGRPFKFDLTGIFLYFTAWGLLAYNWVSWWPDYDWAKYAIGAFLLLFTVRIIRK